jgi:hypothetical protein
LSLALLPLASSLFFLLASDYRVNIFDEGLVLTGAFRVLHGEAPSVDFYVNYGPAQFYVLAALFKALGANVLVARVYDAAVSSLIVGLAYGYLKRTHSGWTAISCAVCVAGLLVEFQYHASPISVCIALSVAGALRLSDVLAEDAERWAFLPVSHSLGLLLLFRYDIALLATVAFVLPIVLVYASKVRRADLDRRRAGQRVVWAVLVLAVSPVLALALLALTGILSPAVRDLLTYTGSNYVATRALPFPGPAQIWADPVDGLAVYFPLVALLFALFTLQRARRDGLALHSERTLVSVWVFAIVTGLFFSKGFVRTSGPHMLFANVPAVLLVFLCLTRLSSADTPRRRPVVCLSLAFFGLTIYQSWHVFPLYRKLGELEIRSDLPALSFFGVDPDRLFVARYIASNTDPGDRIHSATGRHDKIFLNDAVIYFLTQRLPATRWHHYDPGIQTTGPVQRQMIQGLEQSRAPLVLVDVRWDAAAEPNESADTSGVRHMDTYLAQSYHLVGRYGDIFLFERN